MNDHPTRSDARSQDQPAIGCILVNYRTPRQMLRRCLDSLAAAGVIPATVIVDNASGDGVAAEMERDYPGLEVVFMPENAGFAAAVNRGLVELSTPLVMLLNTDAVLTPGALEAMARALDEAGERCAGVAPKMMSSSHEGIIDAIGTVMPPDGASFNRGIGQCDLGQYDAREEVFGVCFGAALLRRRLFAPAAVGPLCERYFLYFEDSDWCMRARSRGYTFVTVPEAVVLHLHSGITRHETLEFKYRLIELNTLEIVVRTFESPLRAWRIVLSRCLRLLARTFIRRRFVAANLQVLGSFLAALPALLAERRRIRRRRTVSDRHVFALAAGEDAYFDTVAYQPHRCLESLVAAYRRLLTRRQDAASRAFLERLERLLADVERGAPPVIDSDLERLARSQPECVRARLQSLAKPGRA